MSMCRPSDRTLASNASREVDWQFLLPRGFRFVKGFIGVRRGRSPSLRAYQLGWGTTTVERPAVTCRDGEQMCVLNFPESDI